jgi:hypothetical protein
MKMIAMTLAGEGSGLAYQVRVRGQVSSRYQVLPIAYTK